MSTPPVYYDTTAQSICVDPDQMTDVATTFLPTISQDIQDRLDTIANTWQNLSVGWAGKTADEAQDFNDKWQAVMVRLYGSDADATADSLSDIPPGHAILLRIATAIKTAADNFGNAEDAVTRGFNAFLSDNNGGGEPGGSELNPVLET